MESLIARFVMCTALLLALVSGSNPAAFRSQEEIEYDVAGLPSPGGSDNRGNALNDWGLVAGYSNFPDNTGRRAMLWWFGHKFPLDTFGGTNSSVTWPGQNNRGLVVGIAQTSKPQTRRDGWSCRGFFPGPDESKYTCLGFAWEAGRMRRLRALGGDNSFATSANNRRQVVGWAETAAADPDCINPEDRGFQAVVWDLDSNRTHALPPFDKDKAGAATAINDRGQVVGISGICDQSIGRHSARHAVLWENGTVKDLGNVGSNTWNTPTAITERGDIVVGFANAPGASPTSPRFRAFMWTERDDLCPKLPGQDICDLGTLDPDGTAQAWGVNEWGQVVGTSCPPSGLCKAFIWENGEMKDLNEFRGAYPHHLENAMDINNLGQISGRSVVAPNVREAFLATPVRER
jgi:probable HAF family extracellular repeat protein